MSRKVSETFTKFMKLPENEIILAKLFYIAKLRKNRAHPEK